MRAGITTFLGLALCTSILLAGCGKRSDDKNDARGTSRKSALSDEPLTSQARTHIAVIADSTGTPVWEAYRALKRIGPDAVPAIVEAMRGEYDQTIKQNLLSTLGEFGLAAAPAEPLLKDLRTEANSALAGAATMALRKIEQARTCGLPGMPSDAELHVVARYRGEQELEIQLGDSGHTVTQIDVVVDRTDRPVILVLTAYDPVVWRVGVTSTAQLAGVLVSGYHTQALLGVESDLPRRVISGEQSTGCDPFHGSGPGDAEEVGPAIVALTGHAADTFHGATPFEFFQIGGSSTSPATDIRYSEDLSLDDYPVYRGDISAGVRGLEELERQGKIRVATPTDVDAWRAGAPENVKNLRAEGLYVVVETITLPPGLFGAHSRSFLIPVGVDRPRGPKAHCTFLFLDGFRAE